MLITPQRIVSLWDMLTYLTGDTFAALGNFGQVVHMLYDADHDPASGQVGIKNTTFDTIFISIKEIDRVALALQLDATIVSATNCLEILGRGQKDANSNTWFSKSDTERLGWMIHALRTNFAVQMQSRMVLVLGDQNTVYLASDEPPFGQSVDDAFPKASEEISEAAKCLALKRNTAAVFHLMRAMELAVQRLAEALGKSNPSEKVWGFILADIHTAIEAMPKGPERDAWSASHAHLYHVKQAWRNDTMHPKTTYTEQQAQDVFDAVKSFMCHLAPLV